MISSRDPGMASAILRDSSTGVSSSSAPTTIRAGTRSAATMLVESGRSIMRTMAPRIASGDCCLIRRRTVDSTVALLSRVVAPSSLGIISRATPEAPSRSTSASMLRRFDRPSSVSAPARVSARTTPLTRWGASRIVANVA